MNYLSDLLSDTFIYSFGWTLLHSLWQGAFVSTLTLLLLFFLKNQSSKLRYNVTVASLLVIVLLSIWTFTSTYQYYNSLYSSGGTSISENGGSGFQNLLGFFWIDFLPNEMITKLNYFTNHLPLILTIWFSAVIFLSLKYLGGFAYSQRLRRVRVNKAPKYWQKKIKILSSIINLKQNVELLESILVKVPMVVGYFKPVILVPAGLFTGIPSEQIEAILIHELAHIKRKDYLVKLLQTIVEILFFFNPFVWWISSVINNEREHSCDDLAISITNDNISFVRALAGLCELEVKSTGLALTFGKSNNQIIKRMERIMKRNDNKNNLSQFTIAVVILLTSFIALGAVSLSNSNSYTNSDEIKSSDIIRSTDVLPVPSPQQDEKVKIKKIKEEMKKLKAKLAKTEDPETQKKIKHKLAELEKKAKWTKKEKAEKWDKKEKKVDKSKVAHKVRKKDYKKKIQYLEQELAKTKDEAKKKELKKKIWSLKKEVKELPPPPPPAPKS